MKTDRHFATRAAAVLLAGLLLAAGQPTAGQTFTFGRSKARVNPFQILAGALALQIGVVKKRFDKNRRALQIVRGPDGQPAYLRQEVAGLIARTGEDLDQAIEKVQPSDLEPLQAWAIDQLGRIQGELAAPPAQKTAALPSGLFTPRAVAVVASLGGFPLLALAKPKATKPKSAKPKAAAPPQAAVPPQDTVAAEKTDSLLDQVGQVVGRIFFLADHGDLEVKLWVGSTAPHATFSFWPQGRIKGSAPAPAIIRTDGKRDHVVRGLYVYRAAWTKGAVTELIEYPKPAGTSVAMSERLDLVNGSGFFCCRFNEQYCHNVANEKECRR
ncbi:MAG: hypothetical protein ABIS20_06505 [Thermoanaerobaculia bacterium]